MRVLVRVVTGAGLLAVPVEATRAVLAREELRPLPSPSPGVLGLAEHAGSSLPVLAAFGEAGTHILVLDGGDARFGLLVEEVLGVVRVREEQLAPAPPGQDERLVAGLLRYEEQEALVLDVAVLRERLG